MSIPLTLTAKEYDNLSNAYYDSNIGTENGIFSYGNHYYRTFVESAEKGYKLPYVKYHKVAQSKATANDKWETKYSEDMNITIEKFTESYDALFNNGESGKQNRIFFPNKYGSTTKDNMSVNGSELSIIPLVNPTDNTQSNYRMRKAKVELYDDAKGGSYGGTHFSKATIYAENENEYFFKVPAPSYISGKYVYNFVINVLLSTIVNGTKVNIPFAQVPMKMYTEADYNNSIFTNPYLINVTSADNGQAFESIYRSKGLFDDSFTEKTVKTSLPTTKIPMIMSIPKNPEVYILNGDFVSPVIKTINSISLSQNNISLYKGQSFTLPTQATVNYLDGTSGLCDIAWDKVVDNNTVGEQVYTASYHDSELNQTFTTTLTIVVKESIVELILENYSINLTYGEAYSLPTTAKIKLLDDSEENVNITWDKVIDTNIVGETIYTASFIADNLIVTKTLTINISQPLLEIQLIENEKEIFYGSNFSLPTTANAKYEGGEIKEVNITWDKTINTSLKGISVYTASFTEFSKTVTATLTINVLLRPVSLTINQESVYINENSIFNTNELIFKVMFEDGSETNKTFEDVIIDKPIDLNVEGDTEYIFSYTENTVTVSDSLIFKIDKTDPTFSILKIQNTTINSAVLNIKTNEPNCVFYFKVSEANTLPTINEIKANIEENISVVDISEFEKTINISNLKSKKEYFIFILAADSNGNTQDSISYLSFKTLPIPFVLNGGVFLGTKNIIIEPSENFDEIHYRIEDVKISQVTNNKDSYDVAYSENNVVQNKLLSSDFLLYNETIEITAPNNLSKTIVLAIQLYKNNEPVSYIVLSEFSVISNTQTVESIFSDYVKVSNKEVIRTFIDTNIEENKKYFYKVISVKQKFVTK